MKLAKAKVYDAHNGYNVQLDVELLNTKIRIYDENFDQTGKALYEGSVGKFIKERIPSEYIVSLISELKHEDKITYRLSGGNNFIEKIK